MRRITTGYPHKILEQIGKAKSLLDRNLAKEAIDGIPQRRAYYDGIDIRLNNQGIDQVIIDAPVKNPPDLIPESTIEPFSPVLIYASNDLSSIPLEDLNDRSVRYFSSNLPADITEIIRCKTVVIVEPQRVLTEAEARILNILLAKGRNVFVFPGTDTAVYNAILLQLGSNLQLIPMSVADHKWSVITDDGNRYRIAGRRRGFLHPVSNHTLAAEISDPFGKMITTKDVVSMTPTFVTTNRNTGFVYFFGSELFDTINKHRDQERPPFNFNWVRNSLITTDIYSEDWTTLSVDDTCNWLSNLPYDIIRTLPSGYTLIKDELDYFTYEERSSCDFLGSFAAHEKGKSLYSFGYSPFWMLSGSDPDIFDKQTDIHDFCKWMAKPGKETEGAFGTFIPAYPYYYTYFYFIWVGPIVQ